MPLKPALSRQAGGLVTIQEQRDGFRQVGRQPFAAGHTFRWGCAGIEEMESLSWARLTWVANEDTRTWDEATEPTRIQPWPQCGPGHLEVGERVGHCHSVLGRSGAVQERVCSFLAGLANRKDEVRRHCRRASQSSAGKLLQPSQPNSHRPANAHPTLASV